MDKQRYELDNRIAHAAAQSMYWDDRLAELRAKRAEIEPRGKGKAHKGQVEGAGMSREELIKKGLGKWDATSAWRRERYNENTEST